MRWPFPNASKRWLNALSTAFVLASLTRLCIAAPPPTNPVGIDFSYAGYEAGDRALPFVPATISVRPTGGDDTALLQSAIDHVAALPLGTNGFRGAVLLRPGRFRIAGQLHLNASGIVLRGSGSGPGGTIVVAEGNGRRTLLQIGTDAAPAVDTPLLITDDKVQAGARSVHVSSTAGLQVGDHIVLRRASTAAWIKNHGMSGLLGTFADARLDWKPGSHDLIWDRTITSIDTASNEIQFDAPVTFLISKRHGPGTVSVLRSNAPLQNIGVENLVIDSAYDSANPKDEEHSWIAIELDHVEDAWVRNVTARHFVASAARVDPRGRRITLEDCSFQQPVSEIAGYRRQAFAVYGQQVLVHRCHSEYGMNDFATGLLAAGPNVFLDCDAQHSIEASGSFEGLAAGVLYEKVRVPDARIQLLLDDTRAQGAGWTSVNSVILNSSAKSLDALGPYDGPNFVVESPQPLYETQLAARGLHLPASSPAHAAEHAPDFHDITVKAEANPPQHPLQIVNGYFVVDGKVAYGGTQSDALWHGNTSPLAASTGAGSSITRFLPGPPAAGITEDLHEVVTRAKQRGSAIYLTYPGLWYDRRRDSHTVFQMQNGDVWGPFFEMPWARSGKGFAWDGLSKFDLSHYNPWYFERIRTFDRIAGEQGLIVLHLLYDTHNVLEIGPHWIDYPWRPANNINDTGIPEPPPFASGYTLAMDTVQPTVTKLNLANEFYSVDYPHLVRKLHHDYIFHTLDQLADSPDVMFGLATQYAGPLSFQQFFQDTVAEWEKLHHRSVKLELAADKAITDTILNDPVRSKQIAVIDTHYWYYLADGRLFAPEAGKNRAYRDYYTAQFGEPYTNSGPVTTQQQMYRLVREYRDRYPNVVILSQDNGAGPIPILMAGGIAQGGAPAPNRPELSTNHVIDKFVRDYLAGDLMKMHPVDGLVSDPAQNWVLAGDTTDAILIYSPAPSSIVRARALPHSTYRGQWIDPATGDLRKTITASGANGTSIDKPDRKGWFLLLRASAN